MAFQHSQKVSLKTTLLAPLQRRKENVSQVDINSFLAKLKNIIIFPILANTSGNNISL